MGQWGPGGPVVLHYFSSVWSSGPDGRCLFRPLAVRLRTIRVIGGLFFGSEAAAAALYRVLPRRSATVVPCVCCRRSVLPCVCLRLIKFVAELTKTVMAVD